jgi:hypothetical protein
MSNFYLLRLQVKKNNFDDPLLGDAGKMKCSPLHLLNRDCRSCGEHY